MLYEKLLELANNPLLSQQTAPEILDEMLNVSLKNIASSVKPGEPMHLIHAASKRVNNTWNLVAQKSGGWFKKDAFLEIVKDDEELSALLFPK